VSLESKQFLQLVVEQRGVDVVVRVFSPDGKRLGEFDSPNGTSGPEGVTLIADTSGAYRIDVSPLEHQENTSAGRYGIKVLELRAATKEELESGENLEALKAKGLALLIEVSEGLRQIRLPETRVRAQIQAATLLRGADEKRAAKLIEEAIAGIREYMSGVDEGDQNYYQSYQSAMQLRGEVLQYLTPHDPELALSFLRSTRTLTDPQAGQGGGQPNQELQLELTIASQIAAKAPKRTLQLAEESLNKGYSYNLIDTINNLRATDPEAAARLAGKIAAKLRGENLLRNQEAAQLVVNLLRITSPTAADERRQADGAAAPPPLLTEQEYRELFGKTLSAGLSYTQPAANYYSAERNSAQNILTSIVSMTAEMERYAPGKAAELEKRATELNTPPDPQSRLWQKYHETISNSSLDAALEAVRRAPQEMRHQLYQQIAAKASSAGDVARARQILTEHISNPSQRRQALRNLDHQAVYNAIANNRIEEALRELNHFQTPNERAMMLIQIVNQAAAVQKRDAVLALLAQAREMIGVAGKAEDQDQMNLLFEIARAYTRFEPKSAFEILEPIADQLNEMSAAAGPLNGFGQQYFREGELMMQNGNSLGNIAGQLIHTIGTLGAVDFDRAKAVADRIQRPEVRLTAYLAIAQHTINSEMSEGVRIMRSRRR
jgi:hypothetical protein